MTDRIGALYEFAPSNLGSVRDAFPHTVSGAVALTLSMLVGGVMLTAHPLETFFGDHPIAAREVDQALVMQDSAASAKTQAVASAARSSFGLLPDDARSLLRSAPVSFAQGLPLGSKFGSIWPALRIALAEPESARPISKSEATEPAESNPLPASRPPEFGQLADYESMRGSKDQVREQPNATALSPAPDNRSFLEKLFGIVQPPGPVLAYAAAEDGPSNERRVVGPVAAYDSGTAVYDISAHVVYLPDGTRLEAHSGLGDMLDDPRYVSEPMRGATPPGVYQLQLREQLFHGVQAVRLIPVRDANTLGRTGLLAHPYMLGPNGDSFGCVSFRDYNAFLQAYKDGEVKKLAVVARLN